MKKQTQKQNPAPAHRGLAWGVVVCVAAALAGGAALCWRAGSAENAVSIGCTALAAAVLAVTLLLSVAANPRTK